MSGQPPSQGFVTLDSRAFLLAGDGIMAKTTFIYALCDPDTNEVRYIGKADNPDKRLHRHLKNYEPKPTHKTNWLKSLLQGGKEPALMILEEVPQDEWQAAEKKWIEHYKAQGNLTNTTEGGLGGLTSTKPNLSDEERKRRSERGKKRMTALWKQIKEEYK